MEAHGEVMHSGKQSTLNRVRQEYWVIKGRQTFVAKIVTSCNLCKQWRLRQIKATPLVTIQYITTPLEKSIHYIKATPLVTIHYNTLKQHHL